MGLSGNQPPFTFDRLPVLTVPVRTVEEAGGACVQIVKRPRQRLETREREQNFLQEHFHVWVSRRQASWASYYVFVFATLPRGLVVPSSRNSLQNSALCHALFDAAYASS